MSLFSTPLSGLNASNTALKSISNNLANMNTNGYKSQTAVFSDMFYQNYGTAGSTDPIQTGLGAQVEGMSQDLTNGPIASTGVNSNMALNGSGYFVTKSAIGTVNYTRAGDFTTNKAGQLVTPNGDQVMGYPATGGVVATNAPLQALNVGAGTTAPASPTSAFTLTTNLNASAAVGSGYQSPIEVYDSLGAVHEVTISYSKTGSNTWSYTATVPSSEIQGGTGTSTTVGSGTLTFDSTGALAPSIPTTQTLTIGPLSDGAATLKPTWQLTDSTGNSLLTQTSNPNANSAKTQDGFAAGTLSTYSVLQDGTVEATFSNGQNRAIGQVAVASFANPEGLALIGGNQYQQTSASGAAVVGIADTGGRGAIVGSSVEQSNVDVATEFSAMIVAQRSYEANAKAVTAFDQLEQATIAMKSN